MNLVAINNNNVITSSIAVAERFEKQHKDVLDSIRQILAAENSATRFFTETTFENRGKQYPMYVMNRDGFSLLAMGFTGANALEWKIKYIAAFNQMEKELNKQLLAQTNEKIKGLRRKLEWNRNARSNAEDRYSEAEARYDALYQKYNELVKEYNDTLENLNCYGREASRARVKDEYLKVIFSKKDTLTREELNTINDFIENHMS